MSDGDDVDRRVEEFNKKSAALTPPSQSKSANGCLTSLIGVAGLFIAIFSVLVIIVVSGSNKETKTSTNLPDKISNNLKNPEIKINKYSKKDICKNKKLIEYLTNISKSADKRIISASVEPIKNWHGGDMVALTTKTQVDCLSGIKIKISKNKFIYKEYYFEQRVPLSFPNDTISSMKIGHVKEVSGSEKFVKSGHTKFYHEVKEELRRKMENNEDTFCAQKYIINGLTDAMPSLIKKRYNIYIDGFGITPDPSSDFIDSASPTKPVLACAYKLKYIYNETPNGAYRTIKRGTFDITVYNYYFSGDFEKINISKPLF